MSDDLISPDVLSGMLMRMFEFAPVAMAITTSDKVNSRYVKVNDAYLRLTGLKWDDIRERELTTSGSAIHSKARDERRRKLDEEGAFQLEEVELKHVDGTVVPTLISAQRTEIGAQSYDIEIIIDVSARMNLQRELDRALITAARTDALTDMPNRTAYDLFISQAIANPEFATMLAFIDLNGFKTINDTYGHAFGDKVLQVIGQRLRESCRSEDFVARLGGDEFVLVMQLPTPHIAAALPSFQRMMVQTFAPMEVDSVPIAVGAAIGTAFFDPISDTSETLLNRADRLMYQAKSTREIFRIVSDRLPEVL